MVALVNTLKVKLVIEKSDIFGAIASTLCVVHCLATPLLFIAHSCNLHGCAATPFWWKSLDYLFLTISFFAVNQSTKNTSKSFMKPILWSLWTSLFLLILNEKIKLVAIPETIIHINAITLAFFHIYNLKFCQCKTNSCCTQNV